MLFNRKKLKILLNMVYATMFFMGNNKASNMATGIGYFGVICWSLSASLNVPLRNIPTFEIILMTYSIAFIAIMARVAIKGSWAQLKLPILLYLLGILGVYGNDVLYISAFKYIPAVQADLINYLWPIGVVLFAALLPKEKFKARYLVAGLIGLFGIYILMLHNNHHWHFHQSAITGYILAFTGVVLWCGYVLLSHRYSNAPIEMIGVYCGVGALISLITLHTTGQPMVTPSSKQLLIIFIIGLTSQGYAYVLWEYGVKKGDYRFLSILSYGNPIISILLLAAFGLIQLNYLVIFAAILVTVAGIIASEKISLKLSALLPHIFRITGK